MRIFEYTNYKAFISKKIGTLPRKGRGELSRIAKALDIHTTMVTHVLRGDANFTLEQTLKLAEFFGFIELETEYLVALVQWERAGDKRSKDFCFRKVTELKEKALNLTKRLNTLNQLHEQDRAIYYSSWLFPMVRLLTAIKRFQQIEAISKEIGLPVAKIRSILDFLLSRGLCTEENNSFKYAPISTYIESTSSLVVRHHLNWRQKAQERFENIKTNDLLFTLPGVLSESDANKIREILVQTIEEIKKISDPSPSDHLYILNIDWLKLSSDN